MKQHNLIRNGRIAVLLMTTMSLFIACSGLDNPLQSDDVKLSSELKYSTSPVFGELYPEITAEMLADGPAPGYRYVTSRMTALDTQDSLQSQGMCPPQVNRFVQIPSLVKVEIPANSVSSNTMITVVAPVGMNGVADFYPHPYHFNQTVNIVWDIQHLNLPANFNYDSLIPLYIDDNGNATVMPFEWRNGHGELVVHTDHFSRYVLATQLY